MSLLLLLSAIAEGQPTSECSFEIRIDGGPVARADTSIPGPATVSIPAAAQQIEIKALPLSADYW
jgi:hypothetical protein